MLILRPACNIQEKQERVCGHRFTPCAKDELRKLQALVPRLRELGVKSIISSDLDEQSAEALARRLNVPVETWQSLRRFNWGRLHGQAASRLAKQRPEWESKWASDATVPVPSGDSAASFRKRMAAALEKLHKAGAGTLLLADAEVLERLAGAGSAKLYRIYDVELKHGEPNAAQAVDAAA